MNLETIAYSTDTGTEAIEKLDRNQRGIAEQINVLNTKTAFSATASTGYTINSQCCYKVGNMLFINIVITGSISSDYAKVATIPYAIPADTNLQISTIASGNAYAKTNKGIYVALSTSGTATIRISGVVLL